MKYIKKVINILLIFVLLVPMFVAPYVVGATDNDDKTLKELKEELAREEANLANNDNSIKLTEAEITAIKNNMNLIGQQISKSDNDIIKLSEEIKELEKEISLKKVEMDKIIRFLQVSSGESEYLEYVFGAKTFTDFIYRMAITEQLTNYNDKLIKEYNEMIVANKQKQIDLNNQIETLKSKQAEFAKESSKLVNQMANLHTENGSIKKGIEAAKNTINDLVSKGCADEDTVRTCAIKIYGAPISSSGMIRPVTTGSVSSEFGPRWGTFHGGIDIGVPIGTPVLAVADGIVTDIGSYSYTPNDPATGTGKSIHIRHIVNGKYYTSEYQHLSEYKVSIGQVVKRGQVIALSGETGLCFGAHLHFALFYGWAGIEYIIWSPTYESKWFNPRQMIDF